MVDKCLEAPMSIRYDTFDAISNNRYKWRGTSHAYEVLGWEPSKASRTTRSTIRAAGTRSRASTAKNRSSARWMAPHLATSASLKRQSALSLGSKP